MKIRTTKKIIKNPAFEKNKKRYLQYKKCFKDNLPYLTVPKLHEMHTIFAHVTRLSDIRKTQDKIVNPFIKNLGTQKR